MCIYDRLISVKLSCIALLFPILLKDLFFHHFDTHIELICKITVFIVYLFCDDAPVLMYILLRASWKISDFIFVCAKCCYPH